MQALLAERKVGRNGSPAMHNSDHHEGDRDERRWRKAVAVALSCSSTEGLYMAVQSRSDQAGPAGEIGATGM